ncbi:hypothetical protein [Pseudoxanthomonas composti]|uniref:Uncharacterized protein n=1 Tax=Pseudoxanthomonas composti TaxID=2137479 RepID=A0A4Q1JYW3_9GAMM|nr:hypothetical protein [Pseudoxanthomonas composti]RXR08347.1 hypothetical protein EPA99_00500 [Pseudoxanthomonas composti]
MGLWQFPGMPVSLASKWLFSVAILFLLGIMPLSARAGVQIGANDGAADDARWVLAMLAEKETDPEGDLEDPQDPPTPYDFAGFDDHATLWYMGALHTGLALHAYDSRREPQRASLTPTPGHRPPIA